MTDKDLLIYAAYGMGKGPVLCYEKARRCLKIGKRDGSTRWRPLTHGADLLEVQFALKINVEFSGNNVIASVALMEGIAREAIIDKDIYRATAYAVLRVAAEIGKMKQRVDSATPPWGQP